MKNSVIINTGIKGFKQVKVYYDSSVTHRVINNILNKSDGYLKSSLVYRVIIGGNKRDMTKDNFIFNKIEWLLQKVVQFLHNLYKKGIEGSFIAKLIEKPFINARNNKGLFGNLKNTYVHSMLGKIIGGLLKKVFVFEPEE